jgi:hypothetical protein
MYENTAKNFTAKNQKIAGDHRTPVFRWLDLNGTDFAK